MRILLLYLTLVPGLLVIVARVRRPARPPLHEAATIGFMMAAALMALGGFLLLLAEYDIVPAFVAIPGVLLLRVSAPVALWAGLCMVMR